MIKTWPDRTMTRKCRTCNRFVTVVVECASEGEKKTLWGPKFFSPGDPVMNHDNSGKPSSTVLFQRPVPSKGWLQPFRNRAQMVDDISRSMCLKAMHAPILSAALRRHVHSRWPKFNIKYFFQGTASKSRCNDFQAISFVPHRPIALESQ